MDESHIAAPAAEAPAGAPPPAADDALTAYDRLLARFGGKQLSLAFAVGRDQSTVAKWKNRGIPLDSAPDIVAAAERAGVALTLHELVDWIVADRARRGAGRGE